MISRILTAILLTGLGIAILKWSEPIAKSFGINDLAELYLGAGGTYTMWKIVGVLFIVVAFLVLMGSFTFGGTPTVPGV